MNKVLDVQNLHVSFDTYAGEVKAVRGVTFSLSEGEVLAIVGESGCGKSVTAQTIMKLNPMPPARIKEGSVQLGEHDIVAANEKEMQKIRGKEVSMIFQDPMTFLNPVLRIETQLMEPILNHMDISKEEAKKRAIELMRKVGIPSPEARIRQYPHQFSGGMRQRIIIAIALACDPKIIIADEPTTALDVTIQAQVLELISHLKEEIDSGIIMITHDLGVVASICDRIAIMYGGKIVETGTVFEIFEHPQHPYTIGLLSCISNPNELEKKELHPIPGSPPDLLNIQENCPFADRCASAMKICKLHMPQETQISATHRCSCWLQHPKACKGGEVQ